MQKYPDLLVVVEKQLIQFGRKHPKRPANFLDKHSLKGPVCVAV
jgi:hypothetical protein